MDNVTFYFLEMLCKNVMLSQLPLEFYVCWLSLSDTAIAGIFFWIVLQCFFALHVFIKALSEEKKPSVKHEWKINSK